MPKRGNWGDWAIIDLPPLEIKKVSCYACRYYYEEDGSCIKTPIIPKKDGNKNTWKNCKFFELSPEYMTYSFMEAVKRVKGYNFFATNNDTSSEVEINDALCEEVVEKKESAYYRFIGKGKKIQFNSKTAKELRNILGFYYGARHYIGSDEKSLERNKAIIDEAISKVPESLMIAFTSVDIKDFAKELSTFFVANGLADANVENCIDYCIAIHSIALDITFSRGNSTGKMRVSIEKVILFLDALTILLFDLRIINDGKYKAVISRIEGV